MGKLTVLALRIVLAVALGGSLFVQVVMIPMVSVNEADPGGIDGRGVTLIVILELGLLAFQVVAVCVWRLLTMVRKGEVFSHAAFRYVDVVIGACAAATLLTFGLGTLAASWNRSVSVEEEIPPGMVLLVGGVGVIVAGIALIVLVLRQLLAQAIDRDTEANRLKAELDEVI